MKAAIRDHYEALAADGTFEVVGTATGVKSETIGQQVAWNNACINYVQQAGSFLRGRIDTDSHIGGGHKCQDKGDGTGRQRVRGRPADCRSNQGVCATKRSLK